jgi:hypothetical protein
MYCIDPNETFTHRSGTYDVIELRAASEGSQHIYLVQCVTHCGMIARSRIRKPFQPRCMHDAPNYRKRPSTAANSNLQPKQDLITKLQHALSDLWPSIKSSIRRIAISVLAHHPTQSTMSIKTRRLVLKKSPLLITQDPEPS